MADQISIDKVEGSAREVLQNSNSDQQNSNTKRGRGRPPKKDEKLSSADAKSGEKLKRFLAGKECGPVIVGGLKSSV